MSQGSQVVADNPGAVVRAAINTELAALYGLSSGPSAPSVTCAYQLWYDTTNNLLKIRDAANANWVVRGSIDQTNKIWQQPMGGGNASIASSGTVDLGSTPAASVSVTGTTTITSFGTSMQTGQIKEVTFSGALTLTYNASSLILPSAANIVTAAGDCALVMCTGSGNYKVVAYTRADGTTVGGAQCKTISFSRDVSLASASVSYTGVGFKPKAAIFFAGFTSGGNSSVISWGLDDGLGDSRAWFNFATAYVSSATGSASIFANNSAGNSHTGVVGSFDADGLTISWTKTGSPTGTITVYALLFR